MNLQTYGIQSSTGYLQPFTAIKAENESRTNTAVLTPDKDLVVPIGPNQVLTWRALLFLAGAGPGNADFQWTTPAAPTAGGWHGSYLNVAGAYIDGVSAGLAASYNALIPGGLTSTVANDLYTVEFEGMLINGANGGYFSLNWAQNVANVVPTILLKSSRLECWFQ